MRADESVNLEGTKMRKILLLLCFVVAIPILVSAHQHSTYTPFGGTFVMPKAEFHTTSAMMAVNSAYSAHPMLNEDGTATHAHMPSLRKGGDVPIIDIPDDEDDFLPIGDAVLPLLLLVLCYAAWHVFYEKCANV